jgi:hypothetical protein
MKRSQLGFSLLEAMIVMGLLGAAALIGAQLMSQQAKNTQRGMTSADMSDAFGNVRLVVSSPQLCGIAFKDGSGQPLKFLPKDENPHSTDVGSFSLGASPVLTLGAQTGPMKVSGLSLTEITPPMRKPASGVMTHLVLFRIRFERPGLGAPVEKEFPLYLAAVNTDPINDPAHGNIIGCGLEQAPVAADAAAAMKPLLSPPAVFPGQSSCERDKSMPPYKKFLAGMEARKGVVSWVYERTQVTQGCFCVYMSSVWIDVATGNPIDCQATPCTCSTPSD